MNTNNKTKLIDFNNTKTNSEKSLIERLTAPLPADAIKWRVSRSGLKQNGKMWASVLCYKTARADIERLNEVFGIDGWQDNFELTSYRDSNDKLIYAFVCEISVKINGEWIKKVDGAEMTDFEGFKGGISSAFKRACTKLGIGLYLYDLEETFVEVLETKPDNDPSWNFINDKRNNVRGFWKAPALPAWALPESK